MASVKELNPNWQRYASEHGNSLIASMQHNNPPSFLHPLHSFPLPSPPEALSKFVQELLSTAPEAACGNLFEEHIIKPPKTIRHWVSGGKHASLRFKDPSVASFIVALFNLIQFQAPTDITFAGWDLFHCHMFVHAVKSGDLTADLGLLFHSKEFPVEWGNNTGRYPVGCPGSGGNIKDPRLGSECSTQDVDYNLRNYLWLHSVNKLYLFDSNDQGFDSSMLGNHQFITINESFFSSFPLGDINYFPSIFSSKKVIHPDATKILAEKKEILKQYRESLIQQFKPTEQNPKLILNPKTISDHLQEKLPSLSPWIEGQIKNYKSWDSWATLDVLNCPREGFTAPLKVKNKIHEISQIFVSELEVLSAQLNIQRQDSYELELTMPLLTHFLKNKISSIQERTQIHNERQLDLLLKQEVDPQHATLSLQYTKSEEGLTNANLAKDLLGVAFDQYRSEEDRSKFGSKSHQFSDHVLKVFAHAKFCDHSLEVIMMMENDREGTWTIETATKAVILKKEKEWEEFYLQEALEAARQDAEVAAQETLGPINTPGLLFAFYKMASKLDRVLYTANTHTTGGRTGQAKSDDGRLNVLLMPPGAKGEGTNPEQLFAAGYSACFIGAMKSVATNQGLKIPEASVKASVDLGTSADGYSIAARLTIDLPGMERAAAQRLIEDAHQVCPYSKATRGNIDVTIALAPKANL